MEYLQKLKNANIEIIYIERDGSGFGRDREFCYLWDLDKIYIAVRSTFDKWFNSRDFVLYQSIENIDFDILRKTCHLIIQRGFYDKDWALEFDIGTIYRTLIKKQK